MPITAAIKFTQAGHSELAGRAAAGVAGVVVSFANNDDTGVTSWSWELLSCPMGSAIVPGVVSANPNDSFTPDVPGSYAMQLTVDDGSGPVVDVRVFAVPNALGWIVPAYSQGSAPHNFNGQSRGWAGPLEVTCIDGASTAYLVDGVYKDISKRAERPTHAIGTTVLTDAYNAYRITNEDAVGAVQYTLPAVFRGGQRFTFWKRPDAGSPGVTPNVTIVAAGTDKIFLPGYASGVASVTNTTPDAFNAHIELEGQCWTDGLGALQKRWVVVHMEGAWLPADATPKVFTGTDHVQQMNPVSVGHVGRNATGRLVVWLTDDSSPHYCLTDLDAAGGVMLAHEQFGIYHNFTGATANQLLGMKNPVGGGGEYKTLVQSANEVEIAHVGNEVRFTAGSNIFKYNPTVTKGAFVYADNTNHIGFLNQGVANTVPKSNGDGTWTMTAWPSGLSSHEMIGAYHDHTGAIENEFPCMDASGVWLEWRHFNFDTDHINISYTPRTATIQVGSYVVTKDETYAKGDIWLATAVNTLERKSAGTKGTYLKVTTVGKDVDWEPCPVNGSVQYDFLQWNGSEWLPVEDLYLSDNSQRYVAFPTTTGTAGKSIYIMGQSTTSLSGSAMGGEVWLIAGHVPALARGSVGSVGLADESGHKVVWVSSSSDGVAPYLGFFEANPISQPNVSTSGTTQDQVTSLRSAIANLGLVRLI